ncbi:MAG TPA: hypothetical protein VHM20_08310 [Gammaproteobacteria bacterium]|nr:hypothetical protein [Gammaproteobacteria bacterium]
MALSNKHRFSKEFKEENERGVLSIDLDKRDALREYKDIFTVKKLNKCRKIFSQYLQQNGHKAPAHTRYTWFNEAANYTLSFTHYIATNQEYANEVLQRIDRAKLHSVDCDLLLSFPEPKKEMLKSFPIEQNAGYIRVSNTDCEKLYYINKAKEICADLRLDHAKIQLIDHHLNPTAKIKNLTDIEVKKITSICGHVHKKKGYIAIFQALLDIKKIHTMMESRRINGRVRNGLEETLTMFSLPLDEKEFNDKVEIIGKIFESAKELDENERIFSPSFIP